MSKSEEIPVEEEMTGEEEVAGQESLFSEEIKVKGEELVETVKRLAKEAGVRRMVIKGKSGKVLLEIPLTLGLAGVILLPTYAALGLVAAMVTECSIVVEKVQKSPEKQAAESE